MRWMLVVLVLGCGHAAAPPPTSTEPTPRADPPKPGRVVVSTAEIEILPPIRWVGQSAVVAPDTLRTLDGTAATLNDNESIKLLEITAYGDDGAAEFQQLIGQQRAQWIVDYLVQHGVARTRLRAKGLARSPNGQLHVDFVILQRTL